ncbi:MAG: insulinase family protein [Deltaproteobacteria bacterium]|nr:insulinase family protein [Deltaproteobacteria bacterium]
MQGWTVTPSAWVVGWVLALTCRVAAASEILAHERYTLDNGLDVILHEDRRLPLVAVDLAYHAGSMHDGSHPGVAHLVEHLMFRGTADLADGELGERLFDAGAMGTNAETRPDHTTYHTVVPADQLPLALWLESNRMAYALPAVTNRTVEQEMQTTVDEWESRVASERDGDAYWAAWSALFPPGHPFHAPGPETIERLRPEHAQQWIRRYHGPANATLVLAGDLPADVREQVQRTFGHRSGGQRPSRPEVARHLPGEQRITHTSTLASTAMVVVAWPTPGLYEAGDAAADVLAFTLEANRLSSMLDALAPKTFLDVTASQVSRRGQSLFVITARGNTSAQPLPMLAAIDHALQQLRSNPLADDDLRRARRRLTVDTLRNLQRLDQRAATLRHYAVSGKDPDWLDQDLARYDAVDERGVAKFVDDWLSSDQRVVVLASPAPGAP